MDSGSGKGASRREFLAGAGLTGAAIAAAWPVLAPTAAEAAAGGALPMTPITSTERAYTAGRFELQLEGLFAGNLRSATGGAAFADVVVTKVGPEQLPSKHLGSVKYEDIVLEFGVGMSRAVYQWIQDTMGRRAPRHKGAIVTVDFNGKAQSELDFLNTLMTEVSFPALDAVSKEAAFMSLKLTPDSTRYLSTSRGQGVPPAQGKPITRKWLSSNFRLAIDGLDCSRVNRVEALTVKQSVTGNSTGALRDIKSGVSQLDLPNLVITLAESSADTFYKWHEDFVIKGNNGPGKTKRGTLEYLASDLRGTYFTLTFGNLGIFRVSPEKVEAGSDAIRRVQVEMYCEDIQFGFSSESWT